MFMEFVPCRDWYLNSFPSGEVTRQRARTHDGLYHAYVVGEANTHAANHQIVREWRTMVRERGDWEKYREGLLRQVKDFEKMRSSFAEEKAAFDAKKKSEEWGREGLRSKLRGAEELLSKERAEWKEKVEDVEADKEHVEADLRAQVVSKDKELHAKDNESLEIDLEAERVKAATAEEAKQKAEEAQDISTSALNLAQNNYAEAQGIVDKLVSESEWMRNRGVVLIANSILNASEMDTDVAVLIDASRPAFGQEFDTTHCSVTDQVDVVLAHAEEVYIHLSLPVLDLVTESLKHDGWCARLNTILDPQQTVELSDEEEIAGGDGDGDGEGGDNE
ncbi:hypothetical protein Hanom_Chr10g00885631 [Helianthus anomalus]